MAHESVFGWILSGSCLRAHENLPISYQLLCINATNNINESDLHEFWNLESVGVICRNRKPS